MAGDIRSLGYGSNDVEGQQRALRFLFAHAECPDGASILVGDVSEERECDDYPEAS